MSHRATTDAPVARWPCRWVSPVPATPERQDLVFATSIGTPIELGNLLRAWTRIIKTAGMPGLRIHDLRHGHASPMLAQGVHPKVASERLGHASVNITLDTYSHVLPGLQEAATQALDSLLAEPEALHDAR